MADAHNEAADSPGSHEVETELTAAEERRLTELLRSARGGEPMPHDVAARLDQVLAGLGTEASSDRSDSPTPILVSRARHGHPQRRRRAAAGLLAAAAVVLGGFGLGSVLSDSESLEADSQAVGAEASELAEAPDRGAADTDGFAGAEESVPLAPKAEPEFSGGPETAELPGYTLELAGNFKQNARRIRKATSGVGARADGYIAATDVPRIRNVSAEPCTPSVWGPGRLFPVRFEGSQAVLALRPVNGSSQIVEVLQCGTADVLRSVSLPVR